MSPAGAAPVTVADLRPVDLFDDLDDTELAEWAAGAERRDAEVGDVVLEENAESQGLLLLLEGTLQLFRTTATGSSRQGTRPRRRGSAPCRRSPRRRSTSAWSRRPRSAEP